MFEHGTPFQGRLRPPYNWVEDTVKQPRPVQNDHCVSIFGLCANATGRTRARQVIMASMSRATCMIQWVLQKVAKMRIGANLKKYPYSGSSLEIQTRETELASNRVSARRGETCSASCTHCPSRPESQGFLKP